MCDDHLPPSLEAPRNEYDTSAAGLTRRRFLLGASIAAGLAAGGRFVGIGAPAWATQLPLNSFGQRSWRGAMHLHGSMSEGSGSVHGHFTEAIKNAFDVIHLTDHDWRAYELKYRTFYGFTANELQYGGAWNVSSIASIGAPLSPSGGLVTSPVSPNYLPGDKRGALRINLSSGAGKTASKCYALTPSTKAATTSRANWNGTIAGDDRLIDVLAVKSGPDAWGDMYFTLSQHPASAGRPAGVAALHYRFRTDITTKQYAAQGLVALVDIPVVAGVWTTVSLDMVADLAMVWPAVDNRDNSLYSTSFWATSRNGARSEMVFSNLRRVPRPGFDPVGLQAGLLAAYAGLPGAPAAYPGSELSFAESSHVNQFGGALTAFPYDNYQNLTPGRPLNPNYGPGFTATMVQFIQTNGGLASLNHPFGTASHATYTAAQRATKTQSLVSGFLGDSVSGADILEVGYRQRNGYLLEDHLEIFDAMSRNGIWLTGNGASDDHSGVNWSGQGNRAYTSTWAPTAGLSDQLAALSAGRAFVGFLGSFGGTIDMALDGAPMGSVSYGSTGTRELLLDITGVPAGGAVQVVKIPVDYAGPANPTSGASVLQTLSAAELAVPAVLTVPVQESCAFRVNVSDSTGQIVAFGQPVWTLREPAQTPVPAGRLFPPPAA